MAPETMIDVVQDNEAVGAEVSVPVSAQVSPIASATASATADVRPDVEKHTAANNTTSRIENYNPAALLDFLIASMRLANDRALAVKMNMRPSLVAKLREGRIAVSGSILMWMQQASGLTVQQLRAVLGDQRTKLRFNG